MALKVARLCLAAALTAPLLSFAADTPEGGKTVAFRLTSSAFEEGQYIPQKYTGEGKDASPPLQWTDPPDGTSTLALIADDPDAPGGTWVHWVVWAIPPDKRKLAEGFPRDKVTAEGIRQGTTSFERVGYGGPMPPKGSDHRYYFKLYALDAEIQLEPGATKADLVKAMEGHILAETQLMGRYKR